MFTGIVAAKGRLTLDAKTGAAQIATGSLDLAGLRVGDSVAVNGVCLTVTVIEAAGFHADVSRETLACTTLGGLAAGAPVNLERALGLGEALGGHLVTGHVDGTGRVVSIEPGDLGTGIEIAAPAALARYIAAKGSVCIDGVSLTVNSVQGASLRVMIVPHTMRQTVIADYVAGTRVNIEVDLIARYVERLSQYTS